MWVYTEAGEKRGKLFGVSRPAGQPAMCGHKPVMGITAKEWEKRGLIEWKEDKKDESQSPDGR